MKAIFSKTLLILTLLGYSGRMIGRAAPQGQDTVLVDPYLPDPNPVKIISGWKYAWGDEFNYTGAPDTALWDYEKGFVRGNELQYYRKENAIVSGGRLLISAKKERVPNRRYRPGSSDWRFNRQFSEWTSASLLGKDKRLFLFGRVEVRAKIEPARGAFPAIWTCGYNKNWPKNGEIDIMEHYLVDYGDGNGKVPVLTSNFCAGGNSNSGAGEWAQTWKSVFTRQSYYENKYNDPDWINKYHVYRMDWDEKTISLYVDDELRNTININEFRNFDGSVTFHNPQFMILNLAMKDHGKGVAANCRFEVDYFRVYQKNVDVEKPSVVSGLKASGDPADSIILSWNPSIDNTGIYRYDIYKNGMGGGYFVGSATSTNFTVTGLRGSKAQFRVRALDAAGNYSDIAEPVTVIKDSSMKNPED